MTTVLLTGYRGFIGSSFLKLAQDAQGYDVVVAGSSSDPYSTLPPNVDYISIQDVYDGKLKSFGIDVVVNCANSYEETFLTDRSPLIVNLQFPLVVLENILNSATHFVNIDTALNKRKATYLARPIYSLSKQHFKEYLQAMSSKIHVSNLICEHVYGNGTSARQTLISELIRSGLSGKHLEIGMSPGEQVRDFVHVDDVALAIMHVIKFRMLNFNEDFVDFEIGSGRGISIRELTSIIQELLHLTEPFPLGTNSYRENEIMHSVANTALIEKLAWKPSISLRQGLADVISYMREN